LLVVSSQLPVSHPIAKGGRKGWGTQFPVLFWEWEVTEVTLKVVGEGEEEGVNG